MNACLFFLLILIIDFDLTTLNNAYIIIKHLFLTSELVCVARAFRRLVGGE